MTDLGKLQLNAILSALDGQPRNPNSTRTRRCAASARTPNASVSASTTCSPPPAAFSTDG